MATLQRELDAAKKRRDALRQQVKSSKDNKDKQKKAERRRRRKKENSFAQLIPVFIVVLVVLVWCTMQDILWGGSIELADVTYDQPNSAQSQFVAQYLSAQAGAGSAEHERQDIEHSGDMRVTGTGTDHLDAVLTLFEAIAYHSPEIIEDIYSKDPSVDGKLDFFLSCGVDYRTLAAGIIGNVMCESYGIGRGVDTLQGSPNYAIWDNMSVAEKCTALRDDSWYNSTFGGYAGGDWGYGAFQWTFAGRRGFLADWCEITGWDPGDPVTQAYVFWYETSRNADMLARTTRVVDNLINNNATFNLNSARLATDTFFRNNVSGNYKTTFTLNSDGTVTDSGGDVSTMTSKGSVWSMNRHESLNGWAWHNGAKAPRVVNNGYGDTHMWDVLDAYAAEKVDGVLALK